MSKEMKEVIDRTEALVAKMAKASPQECARATATNVVTSTTVLIAILDELRKIRETLECML